MFQIKIWIFVTFVVHKGNGILDSRQGPVFIYEPPSKVEFLNTNGAIIDCSAHGNPDPDIRWTRGDEHKTVNNQHGLVVIHRNGSLQLEAFPSDRYNQKIHANIYRCNVHNRYGTIVSRMVNVRAVVKQMYQVQVYDQYVIKGNSAILQCHVPSFVKDYVIVTAWIRDDNLIMRPTDNDHTDGRYSILYDGSLHIRNVQSSDEDIGYWCQTTHSLTSETVLSVQSGRLSVTEPKSTVPPRISHRISKITVKSGKFVELPCAAQSQPLPTYTWRKQHVDGAITDISPGSKFRQLGGSLLIKDVHIDDAANYMCLVKNIGGTFQSSTQLDVVEPLTVFTEPQVQTVDAGNSVKVWCHISGGPVRSVKWLHNGKVIKSEAPSFEVNETTLNLVKMSQSTEGMYQCVVIGDHDSAQGTTQILLGDSPPVIINEFRDEVLQPGPSYQMKCASSGNPLPKVRWLFNGREVRSDNRLIIKEQLDQQGDLISTLNLTKLDAKDGGVYKCVSENKAGMTAQSFKLSVYGIPYVHRMEDVSVLSGRNVYLDCYVSGHPISKISWEKDGGPLLATMMYKYKIYENGTLMIRKVQKTSDEGRYTCVAENIAGQRSENSLRLTVMLKPVIEPIPSRSVKERVKVRLVCSVTEGDQPIRIKWLWKSGSIPHANGITVTNTGEVSILTIGNVHSVHNGNYTCRASNQAGKVERTAQIRVKVAPVWKVLPSNVSGVLGGDANLDCQAYGHPEPTIQWKRVHGSEVMDLVESPGRYKMFANGTVVVMRVTSVDIGQYVCQVTNGIGPGLLKSAFLLVGVPPQVTPINTRIVMPTGEDLILKCLISGDQPFKIEWTKNDFFLNDVRSQIKERVEGDRIEATLIVENSATENSGNYNCNVDNEYGQSSATFVVEIKDPPDPPSNVKVRGNSLRGITVTWSPATNFDDLLQYIVQYKTSSDEWSSSMDDEDDDATLNTVMTAARLTSPSVNIYNVVTDQRYDVRVIAKTKVAQSRPSAVISFTQLTNGSLVLHEKFSSELKEDSTEDATKVIIIAVPVSILIILVVVVVVVTITVRCSKRESKTPHKSRMADCNNIVDASNNDHVVQTKSEEPPMNLSLLLEMQRRRKSDYQIIDKGQSDRKLESTYVSSASTAGYYTEVSPYATFSLPDNQDGSKKEENVRLSTFSSDYPSNHRYEYPTYNV